ncbi:MAG: hypothetical protein GY947_09005 [Rhodobacteraceae bacterium]|nr:hypothetical protein [Paracoccaceae bacterium]
MNETTKFQMSLRRAVYLAIGLFLVVTALIPFDLTAGALPGPDVLYCLTMVYVIRRPEFVPVWSIFLIFFLRDILSMAPLGLWSLLVIVGTEVVRANLQAFREYFFFLEWLWVVAIFAAILSIQHVVLSLSLSTTQNIASQLYLLVFTALAYPVTVAIMRYAFSMTRPLPGELDAWGNRL